MSGFIGIPFFNPFNFSAETTNAANIIAARAIVNSTNSYIKAYSNYVAFNQSQIEIYQERQEKDNTLVAHINAFAHEVKLVLEAEKQETSNLPTFDGGIGYLDGFSKDRAFNTLTIPAMTIDGVLDQAPKIPNPFNLVDDFAIGTYDYITGSGDYQVGKERMGNVIKGVTAYGIVEVLTGAKTTTTIVKVSKYPFDLTIRGVQHIAPQISSKGRCVFNGTKAFLRTGASRFLVAHVAGVAGSEMLYAYGDTYEYTPIEKNRFMKLTLNGVAIGYLEGIVGHLDTLPLDGKVNNLTVITADKFGNEHKSIVQLPVKTLTEEALTILNQAGLVKFYYEEHSNHISPPLVLRQWITGNNGDIIGFMHRNLTGAELGAAITYNPTISLPYIESITNTDLKEKLNKSYQRNKPLTDLSTNDVARILNTLPKTINKEDIDTSLNSVICYFANEEKKPVEVPLIGVSDQQGLQQFARKEPYYVDPAKYQFGISRFKGVGENTQATINSLKQQEHIELTYVIESDTFYSIGGILKAASDTYLIKHKDEASRQFQVQLELIKSGEIFIAIEDPNSLDTLGLYQPLNGGIVNASLLDHPLEGKSLTANYVNYAKINHTNSAFSKNALQSVTKTEPTSLAELSKHYMVLNQSGVDRTNGSSRGKGKHNKSHYPLVISCYNSKNKELVNTIQLQLGVR